jgi:hypothetical protein
VNRSASGLKTGTRLWSQHEGFELRQTGAYVQPRTWLSHRISSLLERVSRSNFPTRHPVLYGSLFELRSFSHRIRLLRSLDGICHLEMGRSFEPTCHGHLARNKRTHSRSRDTQKLLEDCPWLSTLDCHLFLLGWDAGEEFRGSLDTAGSSECASWEKVGEDSTSSPEVPQSSKHDPLSQPPSQE